MALPHAIADAPLGRLDLPKITILLDTIANLKPHKTSRLHFFRATIPTWVK